MTETEGKKKFRWSFNRDNSPPEIFNITLYLSVFVFGILGSARGYDEGCISGTIAQVSFIEEFGLKDPTKTASYLANLKSNISSMVQIGSVGGSLLAMYLVDKLGRIRALQYCCAIWIIAVIIQITSHSVGQLYAGRFIEGLSVGQTVVIGPTYMSEVAPRSIRGLCGCIFAGSVYFGIFIATFANYGTAVHLEPSRNQWVVPTSIKIVFAGSLLIASIFFCIESPRWLVKVNRSEDAAKALSKIRNLPIDHPYVLSEISDISEQLLQEEHETSGHSTLSVFKELFFVKSIRYRLFLGIAAQVLGQWNGANAVTIYAPELFAMIGKKGNDALLMTACLGLVKCSSAYLCAFFVIDIFGRRKALYSGIIIQLLSSIYYASYLYLVPGAAAANPVLTASERRAGQGAIAALFLNGVGWTMGFNSIQYLINSEIFPLRVRSVAVSLIMVLHFANQYGNSKAVPEMMLSMTNYGSFFFFAGVLLLGLAWAYFFLPEVSGRSLESMEELFNLPWYLIGRKGAELCPDYSEINKITFNQSGTGNAEHGLIDVAEKPDDEQKEYEDGDLESNR